QASQKWQTQLPVSTPLAQPAAGGGSVFVSDLYGESTQGQFSLFGVDAATGNLKWHQIWTNGWSLTAPSFKNGFVYVQTIDGLENGLIQCFGADGSFTWSKPFQTQWANFLAPTIDGGVVYIPGGEYNGMYAFDAATGYQYWLCQNLMQYDGWTPSLDSNEAYTYFGPEFGGQSGSGLYAVNRLTGMVDFFIPDTTYVYPAYQEQQAVALSGGSAFVTDGGRLVCFDLTHRAIVWQNPRACSGQPSVVGNTVYVADAGTLSAFDATTGAFLWAWAPPGIENLSGPIVVTDNVAFVTTSSATYGIDLGTHHQVWTANIPGTLAIADGVLYIAGTTGAITAFNLSSLEVVSPTAYSVFRGLALSGSLSSILSVDNQVLRVRQGPTLNPQEAPVQVVLTGTALSASPGTLKLHLQAFANTPGLTESIELWNYATSQWVKLGSAAAAQSETTLEASAPTPSQFVQTGTLQIQARLSWKQTGPTLSFPWNVSIDQAVWLEG
ncbi:MAG TPA: PQQ-binding-like beta-propeller repeat protein, partial [Fimbriimonadaceae bacterium]|nr:PQQ-binding-like beta-propeller repeat protein [Fimbriimonadaceae bacterium]